MPEGWLRARMRTTARPVASTPGARHPKAGVVVGARVGRRVVYALHDEHVGELLDQAVFHVEHLRLGASAPVAGEERAS